MIATPDTSQFTSKSLPIVGPSRNNIYLSNVITANASTQQTVQHRFGLQHGSQGPAPNVTVSPNGNFNMSSSAVLKPGFAHSLRQFGMGSNSSALNSTNQQTPPAAITSSKLAAQLQTINQIASSQKQASAKVSANPSHLGNYAPNIQSMQLQKQLQKTQQPQLFGSENRLIVTQSKPDQSEISSKSATSTEDQIDGTATAMPSTTNRNPQVQDRHLRALINANRTEPVPMQTDQQKTDRTKRNPNEVYGKRLVSAPVEDFDDDIEDLNFDEFDDSDDDLLTSDATVGVRQNQLTRSTDCVAPDVNPLGKPSAAIDDDTVSDDEQADFANRRAAQRNYFMNATTAGNAKTTNTTTTATTSTGQPSTNHQHQSNHFSQNQYHHHIATTNLQCLPPSSLNTSTTNINSSAALKIMVRDVLKFVKTNKNQSVKEIKFKFFVQ